MHDGESESDGFKTLGCSDSLISVSFPFCFDMSLSLPLLIRSTGSSARGEKLLCPSIEPTRSDGFKSLDFPKNLNRKAFYPLLQTSQNIFAASLNIYLSKEC
jgi:hypothetical protein